MSVAILGNPAALYDIHLSGPYPILTANGSVDGGFQSSAFGSLPYPPQNDTSSLPREIWVFALEASAGGDVFGVRGDYNGINAMARKTSGGTARRIDSMDGLTFMPVTDVTGLDAGYANPSWRRVNWFRQGLAMDVGTLGAESGFMFPAMHAKQSVEIWSSSISDFGTFWLGGFGLQGDGAGNWNWNVYGPQVFPPPAPPWSAPLIESVSLASAIPDPTVWTTFDFVFISGTGGTPGEVQLWIDDALFLTRNWVDAPALPGLGLVSGLQAFRYMPTARLAGVADTFMYFGDWTYRCGRFTKTGRELQK